MCCYRGKIQRAPIHFPPCDVDCYKLDKCKIESTSDERERLFKNRQWGPACCSAAVAAPGQGQCRPRRAQHRETGLLVQGFCPVTVTPA